METFEVTPMEAAIDIFLPFSWIEQHPPQGAWTNEEVRFNSAECMRKCTRHETGPFSLTWDESIANNPSARVIGYVSAVREEDPLKAVPIEFPQCLGIMGKEAADALPEHRPYDCKITLQEGSTAPWGSIYPLSEEELRTLREWQTEMEKTGKIKRSTSPAGSPILFVPKPHGRGLHLCVNYRALNRITIPNRYPLPLMQELQDRIQGAQWFTKMDLKNGFHVIRIREGDEWKTAFRTRYGLFEFQVMQFGLTNAPSTFQDIMNHIFSDMLDMGTFAYMEDILVYADTEEKHDETLREVLKRLENNGLAVSPEKCLWKTQEVEFLGYIIGRNGMRMSEETVEAILGWKTPEASGKKIIASLASGRTRRSGRSRRNLLNSDADRHGTVHPDAVRHGICLPDGAWKGIFILNARCQGIFLLDAAVSGHFPSGHSRVRAFSFWMQPRQRILLLYAAVSGQMASGRHVSWHRGYAGCQGTEHRSKYSHRIHKHTAGSRHSDSVQFYSLYLMYIYICYYYTSRFQHKHPASHPSPLFLTCVALL